MLRLARDLGFEHCAYGIRVPVPVTDPVIEMVSSYPASWRSRYASCGYVGVDPTVSLGLRSPDPMLWSDALFRDAPRLWDDARDAGLRFGWAQSARDVRGIPGLLTLARSHDPITEAELRDVQMRMSFLAHVAHHAFSHHLVPRLEPRCGVVLTPRELDALRWAAIGKTAEETGDIFGVSTRTVVAHLSSAMRKLGVYSKISAVVTAVQLGLLV